MNAREERGLVIAATQKLIQKGKIWLVPSQNGKGTYTVLPDTDQPFCSCPDFQETSLPCKHVFAVGFTVSRETAKDGAVTETRTITLTQKKTYKQVQPLYDLAQMEEKKRFLVLLNDLCRGLPDPPPKRVSGRQRTAMRNMVFSAAYKVFSTLSLRRFGTDLEEAHAKGYTTTKLHPIMIGAFLENPLLTPVLKQLIAVTALPLRAVETEFAVDSTGFSTSRFVRWFDEKYGVTRSGRTWCKCHLAVGCRTHVVTAVIIEDRDAADAPQFKPLVDATAESFRIGEVSADKAYLSVENIEAVFAHGGTPYIAFKSNSTGAAGGLFERMYHFYSLNREEYMAHYHKRSNIESANSMIKAKFGDSLRSKDDTAMVNETLCKILCHNLCCLIMSQVELGIDPVFWGEQPAKVVFAEPVKPVAAVAPVEAFAQPVDSRPARSFLSCAGA